MTQLLSKTCTAFLISKDETSLQTTALKEAKEVVEKGNAAAKLKINHGCLD